MYVDDELQPVATEKCREEAVAYVATSSRRAVSGQLSQCVSCRVMLGSDLNETEFDNSTFILNLE